MSSFYCPELNSTSPQVVLSEEEHHHLVHVLRQQTGDNIKLNNGSGILAEGIIQIIGKKQTTIQITQTKQLPRPNSPFAIAFSLLRSKNDEWLVEKVTELGVYDLFPMLTRFSVRNPSTNTISRFQATALAAIKQCDNPFLPLIHSIQSLKQTLIAIDSAGYTPVLASELRPDNKLDNLPAGLKPCFLIGAEGGFSNDEFALLRSQQVIEIALSPLILRAETAAITAAAQFISTHSQ
jgi:16S rRNA (uracil1498-N3)-methyltransferase